MVRFTQFVLAIALLTGPAYAADKIALVCSGTATLEDRVPHPLTGQTLTMDLEHKTVSGFLGHLAVIGVVTNLHLTEGTWRRERPGRVHSTLFGGDTLSEPQALLRPQLPAR